MLIRHTVCLKACVFFFISLSRTRRKEYKKHFFFVPYFLTRDTAKLLSHSFKVHIISQNICLVNLTGPAKLDQKKKREEGLKKCLFIFSCSFLGERSIFNVATHYYGLTSKKSRNLLLFGAGLQKRTRARSFEPAPSLSNIKRMRISSGESFLCLVI